MDRTRDGRPLSDLTPDERDVLEGGLVAVAFEMGRGTLTLTVSQARVCDLAAISPVRRSTGDGMRERLDAWREVHIPAGESVVDGLVRVLRPAS